MTLSRQSKEEDEPLPELVDDREVQEDQSDRFRHRDVAEELATLCVTVDTPANIALYGPWGSGKTGIANLLSRRIMDDVFQKQHGNVRFAHFDAFKYAEIPLRRHFLSQMGAELLASKEANKFRQGLYHAESRTDIDFRALDVWRAVRVFLLLLVIGFAVAMAVTAVAVGTMTALADEGDGGFSERYRTYFAGVVGFSFAPAAVLGGLFAIAGKSLPVTRSRDVPSTDEEFERRFRELLEQSSAKRFVVFVDELDRCAADRVVDVLDTVRTFLDVEGTIFIVAADQHVLEQALTRRVQQNTPSDTTNPYYSSGSAYLDKVFHYQMSLPPLLPGRVTRYAVELVEGRSGVWSDERVNVPWVISVLVPTHVRSPRRVKTLINNFVLTYRLARHRYGEEHLTSEPTDRVLELAKLVTLRTEFPTFARELTLSRRLPELFLRLADDPLAAQPPEVSDEVWSKVKRFAADDLPVDETLDRPTRAATGQQRDDSEEDADSNEAASKTTKAALRQQLHYYLHKTRTIPDPGPDLVFLEGRGNLFDLDESLVEEIDSAAVEGRVDDVRIVLEQQDTVTQTNIIRLLAQRTMAAFPGVEGENLVGVLLAAVAGRSDAVLEGSADEAIGAVNAHFVNSEISDEHLPGAFILGLRSHRAGAGELIARVLGTPSACEPELARMILSNVDALSDRHLAELGEIAATVLASDNTSADAIGSLATVRDAKRVLASAAGPFQRRLEEAVEDDENEAPADGERGSVQEIRSALEEALEVCSGTETAPVAEFLLRAALSAQHSDLWKPAVLYSRHVAGEALSDPVLALLIHRAPSASPGDLAQWLEPVPNAYAVGQDVEADLVSVLGTLWEHRQDLGDDYENHDQSFRDALAAVHRIQDTAAVTDRTTVVEAIVQDLGSIPANPAQLQAADIPWGHARRFVDASVVPGEPAADGIAVRLAKIALQPPQQPRNPPKPEPRRDLFAHWPLWASQYMSASAANDVIAAIKESPWIGSPRRESLALRVAAAVAERHGEVSSPYTPADVASLASEHQNDVKQPVSAWLRTFAEAPTAAFPVLSPYLSDHRFYTSISAAVKTYANRLNDEDRMQLAHLEIEHSASRRLNTDFLRALCFNDVDDITGADIIVNEYERSGKNNDRRRDLLDAWEVLQVTSPTARTRLIDGVMLPMLAQGGKSGLEHIRTRMHLIYNPTRRKKVLSQAMRAIVGGKDADQRLEQVMKDHQIVQETGGVFGFRKREVDE